MSSGFRDKIKNMFFIKIIYLSYDFFPHELITFSKRVHISKLKLNKNKS